MHAYLLATLLQVAGLAAVPQTPPPTPNELGKAVGSVLALQLAMQTAESACGTSARGIESVWRKRNQTVLDKANWIWTKGLDEVAALGGTSAEAVRSEFSVVSKSEESKLRSQIESFDLETKTRICKRFLESAKGGEWDVSSKNPDGYRMLQRPWDELKPRP